MLKIIRYFLLSLLIYVVSYSQSVVIEAKKLEKLPDGKIIASGNIVIKYKDITIKTQKVIYNQRNSVVKYETPTQIISPNYHIWSKKGWYNLKKETGEFFNTDIILENKYYLKAKEIRKEKDILFFKSAKFSTCPFKQYDWFVYSTSGRFKKNDYLYAYNVVFNFCKVPLFYTPAFAYPTSRRKTGLLPIKLGQDSYNTFILKVPFYIVIDESSDITFTYDYRNKQGNGLDTQYRKVFSKDAKLEINGFFFKEKSNGSWWTGRPIGRLRNRWFLQARSIINNIQDTKVFLDLNIPSDPYFLEDFYNTSPLRYTSYLKSTLMSLTDKQDFSLETNFDFVYDLTSPTNEKSLQRLPEVRFYLKERKLIKNIYYDFLSVNTNFYRVTGSRGLRSDNKLRLNIPLSYSYLTNFLEISPRSTFYYVLNTDKDKTPTRNLLEIRNRTGINFIKKYKGFSHNIIPYIEFDYISKVNQENLPFFDKEDRIRAKKEININLSNILNFKNSNYLRWNISTGYTFLDSYFIGDNEFKGHKKPLENSLIFNINGFSGENTIFFDFKKSQIVRSISSLSIPVLGYFRYTISHSFEKNQTNQLVNTITTHYKSLYLSFSWLNNLKQGYIQQKRGRIIFDRRCWNLSIDFLEDFNKTTGKRYKTITIAINIFNLSYNFPLIRPSR